MATRKPLVRVGGKNQQLPAADSIDVPGARFHEGATEPTIKSYGDRWLDTTSGIEYTWVDPGVWVDLSEPTAADVAEAIHASAGKTVLADDDEIGVADSENSWILKYAKWSSIKTLLSDIFVGQSGDQSIGGDLSVRSLNGGELSGHRNKLINGDFSQNIRGLTSVGDDAYCLDRIYVLTETGNVTVAQLTDPESGAPFGIRLTQPDASPKRMGFASIIESKNIRQYASRAMHLAARLRLSTGAAIRYAVIEHTGTADVVTSDVVNNWASATFTPSNFFIAGLNILSTGTITPGAATWGEVSAWAALSSGVKNVIVFIWTESQVAQSVTLDCSRIQYEPGVVATPHEWRMNEVTLCARHARLNGALSGLAGSTTNLNALAVDFGSTPMFSTPAISLVTGVAKGHDPGIAVRDISAPAFYGDRFGGYISCTIAATTANKLHNLLPGAVLFTSEL